ncbi:lytic transglycosylase domain-containing protein, partial [Candidatus Pelagibacter sp.]|nr:lytic transglycosylase domain-containing protein [Candidatus Pelagibacter sp.]
MFKNFLLFIGLLISIGIIQSNVSADVISLIPLKKPKLTFEELDKKISKNILKPLKKPKKADSKIVKEKKIIQVEKKAKLSFKIPKKKPTVSGVNTVKSVKISKYYNKKDFGIAKKAISEMKKSKWSTSLAIAKKAKDKSIYNFIQW